ncbi:MAG: glycosyltransferase [Planctomycetota bacterium]|jgi:glycosyltransferase involved in cell wall biosynthesis
MSLKLICPFEIKHDKGGAHHFVRALFAELEKLGVEILCRSMPEANHDIVFINSFLTPFSVVKSFWKNDSPILLRLDGSAYAYGRVDDSDKVQSLICSFADNIVFQSKYCIEALQEYGVTSDTGSVIYNGVDLDLFSPYGERFEVKNNERIKILFAANSGLYFKGIRTYMHLAYSLSKCDFYVASRKGENFFPDSFGGKLPSNIIHLGHLDHGQLSKLLRSVDIFCAPYLNDAAPNVVIQALASGLPVWHSGCGGIPEQVEDCGCVISDNPLTDLEYLLDDKHTLSAKARKRAEDHFSIKSSAEEYFNLLKVMDEKNKRNEYKRSYKDRLLKSITLPSNYFPRIKAGYFLNLDKVKESQYHRIRASAWIRCFQMIDLLKWYGIDVVIDPAEFSDIDIAIIMDRPNNKSMLTAENLRHAEIPFIYDMVTDTLDVCKTRVNEITNEEVCLSERIISMADAVTAVSPWLADRVSEHHANSCFIADPVPYDWYREKKTKSDKNSNLVLGYAGMSCKAIDLIDWWKEAKRRGCRLITLTEKACDFLPGAEFVQWNYNSFSKVCTDIDIGLCPRYELDATYNKAHSSFKVDVFLAQSIPVIASPVPSYLSRLYDNSCGVLVNNTDEFCSALDGFINKDGLLRDTSENCVKSVENSSTRHIVRTWNNFIRGLLVMLDRKV